MRGKPGSQQIAPLPKGRVLMARQFSVCGIDFDGPLFVKTGDKLKNKVYVMFISCAIVRAVHLEMVLNISTESCLVALRRFISNVVITD